MTALAAAPRADFFVATAGNDSWSGRLEAPNAAGTDGPFATVDRARRAVRDLKTKGKGVTVLVRGGTYTLAGPIVFEPPDSGAAKAAVTYAAYPGEKPVLSGGVRIRGWNLTAGGRWEAKLEAPWAFSQLWVDGTRRFRPRVPKDGYFHVAAGLPPTPGAKAKGYDRFRAFAEDLPADLVPAEVEVCALHLWHMNRMRVAAADRATGVVTLTGPTSMSPEWANFRRGDLYLLENVRGALSVPGEWFLDLPAGTLVYLPMPGESPETAVVVAPRLDRLVEFRGGLADRARVHDIELRGLGFEHANWNVPAGGYSCGQAESALGGAVELTGARDVTFKDCTVARVGEYAVCVREGCRGVVIDGCVLHDLGAGGVKVGAFWDDRSRDPGAVTGWTTIRDCAIAHGGRMHPAACGVLIGHSPHNTVEHNAIYDFYYTGISVGWSWGYAASDAHHNTIAGNLVHTLGQGVLSDMGGIYTLGVSPGTTVADNIFRDIVSFEYGGWGIYFDEGSTGIVAERNLVYGCKSAGFHQHYGRDNIVRNNIFALNRESQLMRTRAENHRSFTFTRNIVVADGSPLLASNWSGTGFDIDRNLYWDTTGPSGSAGAPAGPMRGTSWQEWRARGFDRHSVVADPEFRDPANGDFRLNPGSPASRIGFEPFDYSKAGRRTRVLVPEAPVAWPAGKKAVLPVGEDFEDAEPGAKPGGVEVNEDDGATARVTDETAAAGKRSLKFFKSEKQPQEHDWNPHVVFPCAYDSGDLAGRFAVRLTPGARFNHEWRDGTTPSGDRWYRTGPSLSVDGDGVLQANGKRLDPLPADAWLQVEIRYAVGAATYSLSVTLPGGRVLRYVDLAVTDPLAKVTWWGFVAFGSRPGPAFFLDDVSLSPP